MTTKMTQYAARPMTFTAAIMAGSLSSYAAELLRRLARGGQLTLSEYVHLEESFVISPSGNLAGMRQTQYMPQHTSLIGQPGREICAGPLWSA
jgi:hypothetical protein